MKKIPNKKRLVWRIQIQKRKRNATFIAKFIRDDTFLESKNIYFGTFILENIPALSCNDVIPVKVDSLK